eukprot:scaffold1163_cov370-Pavlova_lutheri.AAC.8
MNWFGMDGNPTEGWSGGHPGSLRWDGKGRSDPGLFETHRGRVGGVPGPSVFSTPSSPHGRVLAFPLDPPPSLPFRIARETSLGSTPPLFLSGSRCVGMVGGCLFPGIDCGSIGDRCVPSLSGPGLPLDGRTGGDGRRNGCTWGWEGSGTGVSHTHHPLRKGKAKKHWIAISKVGEKRDG